MRKKVKCNSDDSVPIVGIQTKIVYIKDSKQTEELFKLLDEDVEAAVPLNRRCKNVIRTVGVSIKNASKEMAEPDS